MPNLLQKASIVLTPTAYNDGEALCIKPEDGSGDFDFSRNSAATRVNAQGLVENVQILSSNLVQNGDFSQEGAEEVSNGSFSQEGAELVTNGSFDTDSDWTLGTGWTISGGKANATSSPSGRRLSQFNLGQTINRPYKINLNVSNLTEGGFSVWFGGVQSQAISSDGDYTIYLTPTSTAQLFIFTNGTTTGSIDNVSVKEVGQDWDFGGDWKLVNGTAEILTSTNSFLVQSNVVDLSVKNYKLQYEVITTNGSNFRLAGGNSAFGTITLDSATIGVKTIYLTSNGTARNLQFNQNSFRGSIDNISVKEVGQNWDLGTGWSIGNNVAISDATQGYIVQTDVGGAGVTATYKIQWEQNITAGTRLRFFARNYNDGGNATILSITRDDGLIIGGGNCIGSGTFTAYVSTTNGYSFKLLAEAGVEADITNITTIQITDDTNLPRINYEGFSYQDALGSELVVNGTFDTDSNWNKDANWSIANGVATSTGTGRMFQSIPFLETNVGTKVKVSFDITERTSGGVQINCYGAVSQVYTDVGTHTFIGTTTNSLNLYINNAGQGNLVGSIDNVSVKEVTGQEVVPDSGCGHWLFEPQSTNMLTISEDFSANYWTKSNGPILTNNIASPDGENNAWEFLSTSNASRIQRNLSVLPAGNHTQSIFVKYKDGDVRMNFKNNLFGSSQVFLITSSGVTEETPSSSVSIQEYSDGWHRISVTYTANGTSNSFIQVFGDLGTPKNSFYIFGAQVEEQSYSTSYIPTSGTTVTRNQDVCNNGGSLASINSTEGVLYAEIEALANDLSARQISLNNGTTNDRIQMYFTTSSNRVSIYYKSQSGVTEFILNHNLTDITQFNKLAFKWKQNDFALWSNGIEVATQTSGVTSIANTLTKLDFQQFNGANKFEGKTKAVAVWKEALSDEELTLLTAPDPVAPTFTLDFDEIANQFTFNRASFATIVNEQGLIETVSNIGSEEIVNGDFEDGSANWTLGSSWSVNNGLAYTDGSAQNFISQNVGLITGKKYNLSFDISNRVGTDGCVVIFGGNTFSGNAFANGTQTFQAVANGGIELRIYGFNANTYNLDNVSIKEYTEDDIPRIDYSTGEEAFLLEPQSTNLVTYSEDFSQWGKSNASLINTITSTVVSPNGVSYANKLYPIGAATSSYIRQNIAGDCFSIFVKKGERKWILIYGGFANSNVWFDSENGVLGTIKSEATATVESFGNDWYRIKILWTQNSTQVRIYNVDSDNSTMSTGNGTDGLYIWGAQLENQSFASSYIPTSGTTVTRVGETCVNATPEINSEEGVLYAEISALANDGNYRLISLTQGTNGGNRLYLGFMNTSNQIRVRMTSGGATQVDITQSLSNIKDFNKIAFKYKENDFALWVNGIKVATDTSGLTAIGLNNLSFTTGSSLFYGNTKDVQIFTEALSDYQLAQLTTI